MASADRLTNDGYEKRTASEIKADLVKALTEAQNKFVEQPADLQDMILDTSVLGIMEYENLMAEMINSYTPAFANQFMFLQMASTLGLNPKAYYKSQVLLEFHGAKGDYIPSGTKVSGFETTQGLTLDTTGVGRVNATSSDEDIKDPDTLTDIQTSVPTGVTCTNPSSSYAAVAEETFTQFKTRAQQLLRSSRAGSSDYIIARLKQLEGVDQRLIGVFLREVTKTINGTATLVQGIECVCGGGDPTEVANVLFECVLETQKLFSSPSDDDAGRTQTISINYYNNYSFVISYTTPKFLSVGLVLHIKFRTSNLSPVIISTIVQSKLVNLINNKQVGTAVTHYELKNLVMDALANYGLDLTNLEYVTFTPSIDETETTWGTDEALDEVKFDCYVQLDKFNVVAD